MHLERDGVLVVALLLSAIFFFGFLNLGALVKGETLGWQVDVFTQKLPNSGVGLGQPSDAFAPDNLVVLYVNVTYNGAGVQQVPVSISVSGPPNPVHNVTFSWAAFSNDTGIAQEQFRVNSPGEDVETVTFGTWTVFASADNGSDFLTFKVGWIVEITSLDLNGGIDPPQGGRLGVQLFLSNLAMVPQNVRLFVSMYDSSSILVGSVLMENMTVDVGGTNFSTVFSIPLSAVPGIGSVNASVYTLNGVPFAPGKSGTFEISLLGDVDGNGRVNVSDVAIVGLAFGSYPGHSRWNPAADVNKDQTVDIRDVALTAQRFGKA
jgi:hypothetical protein